MSENGCCQNAQVLGGVWWVDVAGSALGGCVCLAATHPTVEFIEVLLSTEDYSSFLRRLERIDGAPSG